MRPVWKTVRRGLYHSGRLREEKEKMEVRGEIGATCFVKATVKVIEIGENGTTYLVTLHEGGDYHGIKAEDILFETDPAEMLKAEKQPEEEEPKGYSIMDPELPAVKFETPEAPRRRGRPKKATVEGLMAKAEQARIKKEGGDLWDS